MNLNEVHINFINLIFINYNMVFGLEDLKTALHDVISKPDEYFLINPSVYFLILYNPVFGLKIDNTTLNKNALLDGIEKHTLDNFYNFETQIYGIYEKQIFSNKMSSYLTKLTNTNFPNFDSDMIDNKRKFKKVSRGELRNIINTHLAFNINSDLFNSLENGIKEELQNAHHDNIQKDTYFYYNEEAKYIFMIRRKSTESNIKKMKELYNKMSDEIKNRYIELFTSLLLYCKELFNRSHPRDIFNLNINHQEIEEESYNKGIQKSYFVPRYDTYGCRLVSLNSEESENELKIASNLNSDQFGKYTIIQALKDDHRERVSQGRPGGVHHVFIDKSYSNYAFEFQFLDFRSFILTYFGDNKDSFKELRK